MKDQWLIFLQDFSKFILQTLFKHLKGTQALDFYFSVYFQTKLLLCTFILPSPWFEQTPSESKIKCSNFYSSSLCSANFWNCGFEHQTTVQFATRTASVSGRNNNQAGPAVQGHIDQKDQQVRLCQAQQLCTTWCISSRLQQA